MSDERADLIRNMLRAIGAEQAAQREKLDEIIIRLGRLEREVAGLHGDYAALSVRLDNLDRRVARIEHRLELVDSPAG
jgi:predicted nuclease with TOPRIM domain